jgi:hypothetical protein
VIKQYHSLRIYPKKYDKPIGVIIHLYIETSQGNSLCSLLLFQTSKNVMFFFFIFFSFFFYKIREQEGGTGSAWKEGWVAPKGRGRWQEKEVRG